MGSGYGRWRVARRESRVERGELESRDAGCGMRVRVGALLLAWVSVSLVFFSLSRPVRAWTGQYWGFYLAAAVVLGIAGCAAALRLSKIRAGKGTGGGEK